MYIINPEKLSNKYECKYSLAKYIMKNFHLPLLARSGDIYIFADTKTLRENLKKVPFWIWALDLLS
jgi:hypothetical protein